MSQGCNQWRDPLNTAAVAPLLERSTSPGCSPSREHFCSPGGRRGSKHMALLPSLPRLPCLRCALPFRLASAFAFSSAWSTAAAHPEAALHEDRREHSLLRHFLLAPFRQRQPRTAAQQQKRKKKQSALLTRPFPSTIALTYEFDYLQIACWVLVLLLP